MREHPLRDIGQVGPGENAGTELGMLAHVGPLLLVERPGFCRIASATPILPTSCSTPASAHPLDGGLGKAQPHRDGAREAAHGLRVVGRAGSRASIVSASTRTADSCRGSGFRPRLSADHVGDHLGVVEDGAIAPQLLGRVQGLIAGQEEVVRALAVVGEAGHADAHGERRLRVHERGLDRAPQPLAHQQGVVLGGLGQHQRELLAAQPAGRSMLRVSRVI